MHAAASAYYLQYRYVLYAMQKSYTYDAATGYLLYG